MQNFPTQSNSQPPVYCYLNPETDKLMQKWLKMQINQHYWSMASRTIMFILVAASIVFSMLTLQPLVNTLMGSLTNYQTMVSGITDGKTAVNANTTQQTNPGDIIKQLTPEQKRLVQQYLNQ